jgi:hypothetical protein
MHVYRTYITWFGLWSNIIYRDFTNTLTMPDFADIIPIWGSYGRTIVHTFLGTHVDVNKKIPIDHHFLAISRNMSTHLSPVAAWCLSRIPRCFSQMRA